MEMESSETILSLADQGMGITVYPEMLVRDLSLFIHEFDGSTVYYLPFNDPSTIGELVVSYHRERYLSNFAKDFIEATKSIQVNIDRLVV